MQMKKLNGTVTLSILEEDNTQRVIFRIIPLCTKDGLIFENRKTIYPDFGSLRIIPDKREQSSFKERMRAIGNLCCVQLLTDGKELTKVRPNRNYDPNQGECNQYAIYSDVICGFEQDAVFEVFREEEDYSQALTENVLLQRGKVLYGPVAKREEARWDGLKPFGNEKYLMQVAEGVDGSPRTYYWNPEAIVTWRQRKKAMGKNSGSVKEEEPSPGEPSPEQKEAQKPQEAQESIPIGMKLELLDERLTHDEHITELNLPVSDQANRLNGDGKPQTVEIQAETPLYYSTPIAEQPKNGVHEKQREGSMHVVVERQLKERQSNQAAAQSDNRPAQNPLETLRGAIQDVWQIPALRQDFIRVLGENKDIGSAIAQSSIMEKHAQSAYSAAKAELDEIEAERIALLIELDKAKANYQQTKEKMLSELTKKKQDEIALLDQRLIDMNTERQTLEEILSQMGDAVQKETLEQLAGRLTTMIATNGSDLTVSPTIGFHREQAETVETIRSSMSALGFLCKQDCVTELMIFLSLYDEICLYAKSLWEAELYIKNVLQALGLGSVTAWPGAFGTLRILNFLPENDLRTPTVEVIKNNRTPLKAYGHKTIRLVDNYLTKEIASLPVIRVPIFNKERGQEMLNDSGKPISLRTVHSFGTSADLLHKDREVWFDELAAQLSESHILVAEDVFQEMRVFARVAAPQVIGGFMEAADAATLAWIVPQIVRQKLPKDQVSELIGNLPRCMRAMSEETY